MKNSNLNDFYRSEKLLCHKINTFETTYSHLIKKMICRNPYQIFTH